MKISIFSQSLFALPLMEAIDAAPKAGFSAIELSCMKPHFDIGQDDPDKVSEHIRSVGLDVSALSLFNSFTDRSHLEDQIQKARTYILLAPVFRTKIIKMTPGPPASAAATEEHWNCLRIAIERLSPVAEEMGVRLAFETHMRQLTDTLAGSMRLLELVKSDAIGFTVDFSNIAFAGDDLAEAIDSLSPRMYNTHVKNGVIKEDGSWQFNPLNEGLTDYSLVISMLKGYDGYLTIECLGPDASKNPIKTAKRDLDILKKFLSIKN